MNSFVVQIQMNDGKHSLVEVVEVDVVDVAEINEMKVTLWHFRVHRFSLDVVELVVVVLVAKKRQADGLFRCQIQMDDGEHLLVEVVEVDVAESCIDAEMI